VRDERTNIDGILNAIKERPHRGNVWFANPNGFIVGNGGVVNVGSLNVSTPSQQFVNNFFSSPGSPDDASVTQLLNGTAPRNAAGLISIQGKVNAIDGINLSAGVINVGGTLYAGARFLGNAPDFTDVVNANGIASRQISSRRKPHPDRGRRRRDGQRHRCRTGRRRGTWRRYFDQGGRQYRPAGRRKHRCARQWREFCRRQR